MLVESEVCVDCLLRPLCPLVCTFRTDPAEFLSGEIQLAVRVR